MNFDQIVFWQERPSPHQAPWIRAVAQRVPHCRTIAVFQKDISAARVALGWRQPDYGRAEVFISPERQTVERLLNYDCERSVHIFSGAVHVPAIDATLRRLLPSAALVGILSEGRDWRGWRGWLRQAHSLIHERRYRRSVGFVLAIGRVGVNWYGRCGYGEKKIFPFCYVVESPGSAPAHDKPVGVPRLVAIGQLIPRKRFDLLLTALRNLSGFDFELRIIGDGELRSSLEDLANGLGIKDKVVFTGVLDNLTVRGELEQSDVLVLPSRWDGWGAVVNEALMNGVPVICNDYCGAADLIRPGFNGNLFQHDDVSSLTSVLKAWLVEGPLTKSKRSAIRSWSHCIADDAIATYFLDIIRYVQMDHDSRPVPPWLR